MPPKPAAKAPKLTKKQLEELKKEEQRKKEEEERRLKEEQEERQAQERRLEELARQKLAEQQRVKIILEKEKYHAQYQEREKQEQTEVSKQAEQQRWQRLTEQYRKSYQTEGPRLSTFMSVFDEEVFESPEKEMKSCEQAQAYVQHIGWAMLQARALGLRQEEEYYQEAINRIRQIENKKLQRVMIQMANSAEEIEEKNVEIGKKGEPSKKMEGLKIIEYRQYMNARAKVGMFLNSNSTKNLNKFRPIEIREFGFNTEIPSKWMNANTIVRFEWVSYNPFSDAQREEFLQVGGVYMLEFYELLLPSKRINNITLKKHYKGSEILQKFKLPTNLIREPFNVMYQIPSYVFLHTHDQHTLRFAQYDPTTSKWQPLPNDTVVEYEIKEKKATCRLYRPDPIAYIQSRTTDYPYIAWQLRCIESGRALLDIQLQRHLIREEGEEEAKRLMLQFQIDSSTVRLGSSQGYPQLQDLTQGEWTAGAVLYELSQRGIHLLPVDADYEQANLPAKNKQVERNAINDIAYAVEAFYIRSEPNHTADIKVKIRENLEYEHVFLEDQEKDWKQIQWLPNNRCEVTNRKIQQRHINLEVLLEHHQFCEPSCLDRIRFEKNYLFKRNIKELLALTRVLSFTRDSEAEVSRLREVLREREIVKA